MSGTTLFCPSPSEISETDFQTGLGEESKRNLDRYRAFIEHCREPLSRQTTEQRFRVLASEWRSEMAPMSSITEMAMHPAYQQIIGMGPEVLPSLLRELERDPTHWFWALKAITGADPVKPQDRGRVKQMTNAWLRWAREHGYEW